jgi:hypothetical protein
MSWWIIAQLPWNQRNSFSNAPIYFYVTPKPQVPPIEKDPTIIGYEPVSLVQVRVPATVCPFLPQLPPLRCVPLPWPFAPAHRPPRIFHQSALTCRTHFPISFTPDPLWRAENQIFWSFSYHATFVGFPAIQAQLPLCMLLRSLLRFAHYADAH